MNINKLFNFALLAVSATILLTISAQAATYTVDRTDDATVSTCSAMAANDCTLRGAIAAANAAAAADDIDFDPSVFSIPQTIILGGTQLSITGSAINTLTINGPGANLLTISGNNASRVINIGAGAVVVIGGVTISDGLPAGTLGGGIFNNGNNTILTLNNSVVTNNGSTTTAAAGAGIYFIGSNTSLTLNNSAVTNNKAIGGSGIGIFSSATLTLNNSTVSFNDGDTDRGGSSAASGTGITSSNGTLVMNNSTVTNNIGGNGTGIFISSSLPTTITDSTISNNFVSNALSFNGGGIFINTNSGTVNLIRSTVSGNTARNSGGGIFTTGTGNLNITDSTISGNRAGSLGGGISNGGGMTTLTNSTVSGNSGDGVSSRGGGIYVTNSSVTLKNSTLSNNSVPNAINGGGIYNIGATAVTTLDNTIIANSTSGSDCVRSSGTINASYSLIEQDLTCVNGTNTVNLTGDPNLGPLQNNGGQTLTHSLLAGSIAIDQGNSALTTDQRGFPRPYDNPTIANAAGGNGSDIGSFELGVSLTFTVTQIGDAGDGTCDATCTLRDAVLAANANAGDNFIGFSPAVFSTPQTITLGGTELTVANNGTLGINGTGESQLTVSGNNLSRVFSIDTGANVTINGITVTRGNGVGAVGSGNGGGFYNLGTLILNNATVSNSSATNTGGGISNFGTNSVLTLINSTVSGNSAAVSDGGGIYNTNNGIVTLTDSTVNGNSTNVGNGGGIGILSGTLILTSSTVSGNFSTGGNGGGISNSATANLTNSTVSGNSANIGNGGGISNSGTLNSLHLTLSNNSAAANLGGGIYNVIGTTTLDNTIIANSTAGGDCVRPTGTINAIYSLIEGGLVCVNGTNTVNLTGDPNLGPLQNNGGATFTHALLTGSIAIDAGNSTLSTDQRTATRPYDNPAITNAAGGNGVDIGAFEVQAPSAASVSIGGRITDGKTAVANAIVYLSDGRGNTQMTRTTSFGYYRFDDIEVGQTITVQVSARRYSFAPQVVAVNEYVSDLNFTAQ